MLVGDESSLVLVLRLRVMLTKLDNDGQGLCPVPSHDCEILKKDKQVS